MTHIEEQVHDKFKVFAGDIDVDRNIGNLANDISTFAADNKIAAKSIGVEYLETAKRLIITLGYRSDEEYYPIKLQTVALGKVDTVSNDFAALEQKLTEATRQIPNIICHEIYVTEDNEFLMVFMTTENS